MEKRVASLWDLLKLPDERGTLVGLSRACVYIRVTRGTEVQSFSSGTGFFFEFDMGDQCVPCIVTNRHVVSGFSKLELYMHLFSAGTSNQNNRTITIKDSDFVLYHPDTRVDLAIIGIAKVASSLLIEHQEVFAHTRFTEDMLEPYPERAAEISKGALICGYPAHHNNYEDPLLYDGHIGMCTKRHIYASITANNGNSGSPLCTISNPHSIYAHPNDIKDIKLIGVVCSAPRTQNRIVFKNGQTAYPTANAVNARCLMDFKSLIEVTRKLAQDHLWFLDLSVQL